MSWHPYVTIVTIAKNQGHFLLVEEQADGREVLNQSAGHLEPTESLFEAALHETFEETGWRVELNVVTDIYLHTAPPNDTTYQRVCFAVRPVHHHPEHALDDGIVDPRWLTRDELTTQPQRWRSHLVLHCIDDYLADSHYPLVLIRSTHVLPSLPQA